MDDVPHPPQTPPVPPPLPADHGRRELQSGEVLSSHQREVLVDLELSRFWIVFWLALFSLFVATVSLAPVVQRWIVPLPTSVDWDRWIYLLLFLAVAQAAYVLLFVQMPHWFTLRSSAVFFTALACVYAAGLATFTFSRAETEWIVWLDLADEQQQGTTHRWCLIMLCLLLPVAYYQGRISSQWRQRERGEQAERSSLPS